MPEHYLKDELYELIKKDDAIFEFLQSASLDGLWYWDLENPEHEWMNAKFWTTLGYDPEDMPDRADAWQDIIFPEDRDEALKRVRAHFANPDVPYDQVVRYRHKDGSTVWIRCRGLAIRDENGTPIRMLGAHNDITELKKAERQVTRDAQRYKRLVESQSAYLITLNLEGNYTYVNDYYCDDFGWPRETLIGHSSSIGVVEEDQATCQRVGQECFTNPGKRVQARLRKIDANGALRTADWEFTAQVAEGGLPPELVCVGVDVTEQLKAEAALQRTTTLLNDAQRIANMGAWELDVATNQATLSDQLYAIFELPVGTPITGSEVIAYHHPDDQSTITKAITQTIEQQMPFDVQCRFITAKGKHHWVRALGYPVIENNHVTRLIGTFQDISGQKQLEQYIRKSEQQLFSTLASMDDEVFVLDSEGVFREVYNAVQNDSYLPPEALLDQAYDAVLPPALANTTRDVLSKAEHNPDTKTFAFDYSLEHNGRTRWFSAKATTRFGLGGHYDGVTVVARDITDRKHAEQALAESEAKFRSFIENANDVILTLSPEGELLYISPRWEAVKGFSADGLVGTSFVPLVHPDDVLEARQAIETIVTTQAVYSGLIYRSKHGDGTWHWFAANGAPISDDAGNVTAILVTVRDITSDKAAQHAMQATLNRLEQALANNDLLMKELHHRVKNNLAIIASLLALQAGGLKDDNAKHALHESRTRIVAMSEIHELMYRQDSSKSIAFHDYLASLVKRMERSFGRLHGIGFSFASPEVEVTFDQAIPLGLIINELLTNATKYAFTEEQANPHVDIAVTIDKGLTLTVTDNGVGLADDEVLETSDSLGMTVIQSLTDQLGGHVAFHNRPDADVGLRVTLHMPLVEVSAQDERVAAN